MKNKKDQIDPFSPLYEQKMHAERLSREWDESQHAFACCERIKVQLAASLRAVVSKAIKVMFHIKLVRAMGLKKVKLK